VYRPASTSLPPKVRRGRESDFRRLN